MEVADINSKLTKFLSNKAKKAGTITKLVAINMSRGSRRKGGVGSLSKKPSQPAITELGTLNVCQSSSW